MFKQILSAFLLALVLFSGASGAERCAVLVIVDGLGSAYVYPGQTPRAVDGSPLAGAHLGIVNSASATCELRVPSPDTGSGNAVIATGYSGATAEAVTYYGATIYDALRAGGYLCMAIMETGDTAELIAETDIAVYERNNSVNYPEVARTINSPAVPSGITDIFRSDLAARAIPGNGPGDKYRQYDEWPLNKAIDVIGYMARAYPEQKYLLVVTVAGTDMAGHERGYDAYRETIEALDGPLSSLTAACRQSDALLILTADHGMAFKTPNTKGAHASGAPSLCNETRLAPLVVLNNEKRLRPGIYGQQCLAPTLLSLMECPNTLSIADGVPVTGASDPSLYLVSDGPVDVAVESPGFYRQTTVNGTCRIGPLAPGRYRVTTPWGVRTAEVAGDVTIRLAGTLQGGMPAGSWVPYVATAVVAAAGIALGLGLTRRNGNRRGRK